MTAGFLTEPWPDDAGLVDGLDMVDGSFLSDDDLEVAAAEQTLAALRGPGAFLDYTDASPWPADPVSEDAVAGRRGRLAALAVIREAAGDLADAALEDLRQARADAALAAQEDSDADELAMERAEEAYGGAW